jgi:hypothetical protein
MDNRAQAAVPHRTEVACLRANAANFRRLAARRSAVDQACIADKLLEVAAELETKARQLEVERPPNRQHL